MCEICERQSEVRDEDMYGVTTDKPLAEHWYDIGYEEGNAGLDMLLPNHSSDSDQRLYQQGWEDGAADLTTSLA